MVAETYPLFLAATSHLKMTDKKSFYDPLDSFPFLRDVYIWQYQKFTTEKSG